MLVAQPEARFPMRGCETSRTKTFKGSPIGAMKQPAIVKGIVVYEDAEGETALVPTGPCKLEDNPDRWQA